MKERGEIVGFFPFEMGRFGIAKPMYMCDCQGIIIKKEIDWKIEDVLRGCGLIAWDFSELIFSQVGLQKNNRIKIIRYPVMNLSNGYEAYISELKKIVQKTRQIFSGECEKSNGKLDPSDLKKIFQRYQYCIRF
jgi:hypothetical protein